MKPGLLLEDSTLREGEQSPGVTFSGSDKLTIARMLADLGVGAIEVGTPAMGGPEREAILGLVKAKLPIRLIGWNRGNKSDLEASFACGLEAVHIGLPASDHHITRKFGRDRAWVISTMQELVAFAKGSGAWVSVSAEDVGRADVDFLREYALACQAAGADRMRVSDTIGLLTPDRVGSLVSRLTEDLTMPIQVHMHNDFGLATANTISGVLAGARHIHVTVNGLGERAGIASLDEVVMALKYRYGIDLGVRTEGLADLAAFVARAAGRPLPANKPITGSAIFQHESGIHVNGTLRLPDAFEPFPPELVGTDRSIVIGKHSGRAAIAHVLRQDRPDVDEDLLPAVLATVRLTAVKKRGALTPDELVAIYDRVALDRVADCN